MAVRPSPFPFRESDLFATLFGLVTPLGIQASNDHLFKGAIFGRDSLRVGLDLVPWLPSLSETIIFSLAHLQATEARAISDAKRPGQIPHEARFRFVGPRQIGPDQQALLDELAERWGGTTDGVVQYGSADATPQFVRLVARHCRLHGDEILDETFRRADGAVLTLRESLRAAVTWTEEEVRAADRPLLGFLRSNKAHGHRWQILQDGATSIIHPDGLLANAEARVETIGLQGLAYDALVDGADLLERDMPDDARRWRELAVGAAGCDAGRLLDARRSVLRARDRPRPGGWRYAPASADDHGNAHRAAGNGHLRRPAGRRAAGVCLRHRPHGARTRPDDPGRDPQPVAAPCERPPLSRTITAC